MKNICIEVYEGDEKASTIRIPVAVLRVASKLFPSKYMSSLDRNEVSLSDLLEAASSPDVSGRLIEVEDHKDDERVVISVG